MAAKLAYCPKKRLERRLQRDRLNAYFVDTHQNLETLVSHKKYWEEIARCLFNIANPNNDAVFI